MVVDPIGDMINRLKNAGRVGKKTFVVPYSRLCLSTLDALSKHDFVGTVTKKGKKNIRSIEVQILFDSNGNPRVSDAKRISLPSRRVYRGFRDIRPIMRGFGVQFLSTPKGIMSGKEAKAEKLGGEVLFKIW